MKVNAFVGKMLAVADSIGMLVWYREDLTVIDAEIMERAPELDYVWAVSETSSNLMPVGLHIRYGKEITDLIRCREKIAFYQVNATKDTIKAISPDAATKLLQRKPAYTICEKTNKVMGPDGDMGWLMLEGSFIPRSCKTEVKMRYVPKGTSRLSQGLALQLALAEAERRFGLWFYLISAEAEEEKEPVAA